MSINLLDMLKDQVTGQLASGAAGFLGESESNITKALGDGIFPALLGGMINQGGTEKGATSLLSSLKDFDGGLLDNIGGLFGGGSDGVAGLMNSGGGVLDMLLGNKMGGIVETIGKMAGLKGSATSSLLKLAAPYLMSMVGSYVRKNGLGLSGFMDMLKGQKDHVSAAGPSDWNPLSFASGILNDGADMVGDAAKGAANLAGDAVDAVGDTAKSAANMAGNAAKGAANLAGDAVEVVGDAGEAAVKTGGSILKWLLPLFLILMLLGYFFGFKTGCNAVDSTVDKANDMTESTVGAVGDAAGDAANAVGDAAGNLAEGAANLASAAFSEVNEAAKTALDKISFAAGSVGSQMMAFIKGGFKGEGRFRFNNLTFDTGSARITAATAVEVDNLAAILAAYPGVRMDVEGYTDNTGNAAANVELSKARAQAVKARLIAQGVDAGRIGTAGLGASNPVADNGTAEGRAQNRRIEVTFSK